jgi:hypothetical protein
MSERKKLSDILRAGEAEKLAAAWATTAAAAEFAPLPTGEYDCRILSGEFTQSKSGTPGYKLTLEVTEGEHAGRHVWHDVWLTPAALPMAKRDLSKLGIADLAQLSQPLPRGILVRVKVKLRPDDNGATYNRVRSFDVTGVEPPDEFAPPEDDRGDDQADADAPTPTPPEGTTQSLRSPPSAGKPPKRPTATASTNGATGQHDAGNGPYGGDRR